MRRIVLAVNVFYSCVCWSVAVAGGRVEMGGREYALAVRDGAKARLTLKVVDEVGSVVPGANVKVSFARYDSEWVNGTTDTNGFFNAEGLSSGRMLYTVTKDGYYRTSGEYGFGEGKVMLEGGKWFPWNPTNAVILKQVRSPVAMYASSKKLLIPVKGTNVSFDLEKGDWVEPYGSGKCADLTVNCDDQFADPWTGFRNLALTFGTNSLDGVRSHKLDSFSIFRSLYEAPLDGYEKTIKWSFDRTSEKMQINEPPPDEYFVFRVRTEVDAERRIVKAFYGKIYGPVQYGDLGGRLLLRMVYYFNPDPNSRSLEFDTKKNLSGQRIPCP